MRPGVMKALSLWRLTAALTLMLASAYIYFTFGEDPFGRWTEFVFRTPLGIILYAGAILNILSVSAKTAYARLKAARAAPQDILDMDAYAIIPVSGKDPLGAAALWMKNKGFEPKASGNSLCALKGRLSFLPGALIRMGLVVLMASAFMSAHLRKTEEAVFHEGEEKTLLGKKIRLIEIKSSLPEEFLDIGQRSAFRLERVSSELSSSGKTYAVGAGFPAREDGLYLRITHMGFAQPVSFKTQDTALEETKDLDLLPPGKTAEVLLPGGQTLSFTLMPERTINKGLLIGKLFNLRNPSYSVALKGRDKPVEIAARPSEGIRLVDSELSLGRHSLFVKIQSVYDPALLWIYAGLLISLSGIALMPGRFFWYERRMCVALRREELLIGYSEEFYKKWGIYKFHKWKDELAGLV
ncbi:MAG: hypothetical protein Q8J64_09235 [Thermodesulfovibrionales bacterium]|nr:hypothetical protein [Thermodesulfovibrionales bacterium]